jgi:NAD+ kinase
MKTIGVIANWGKPYTRPTVERLAQKAGSLGARLVCCEASAEPTENMTRMDRADMIQEADILAALGGDGTVLRTVRFLSGSEIPMLGINIGSLGFMTSVPENELEEALEQIQQGSYSISIRSMIDCKVRRDGELVGQFEALNDIAVGWGQSSRVVSLGVFVNWESVTSFLCDGLILSTPTGSTGHSLSAGGPILHPETNVFVLSMICPHTLSNRPLVLPDNSEIAIEILSTSKDLLLSADGQEHITLQEGDRIEMEKSLHVARLIRLPGHSYFSLLRQKLHWRGSNV